MEFGDIIANHLGEMIVGMVLAVFGFAFRNWSSTISQSTKQIIHELKSLSAEFHKHRIETENRVTRVETRVDEMEKNHHRNR